MRPSLTLPILSISLCIFSNTAIADDQTRTVAAFNSISTQSACKITVEVGKTQSITLKGDSKFIARLTTVVNGNELNITDKEKGGIKLGNSDEIVITVPELKKFKFQGAGSSKINNLNADDFELSYEGAGSLTANGKIKHLVIRSQGVGSIDMKDVTANDVEVKGEGVGSISVTAIDKLSASLQGIGSLTYYGHPKTVSKAVQGIGSIKAGD